MRRDLILLVVSVSLAVAVYVNSLNGEFIYDDIPYVKTNPQVTGEKSVFAHSSPPDKPHLGLYRPLVMLSYRLNWLQDGFSPSLFHGTNMLLHAMVTACLFLLVRILSRSSLAAFLGALFFAVHPVHVEAVAWIVGRAEILAAFFCLLFALFHLGAAKRRWMVVPAALSYLAACLCKENSLAFPALLLLLDLFRGEGRKRGAGQWVAIYGTYAVVLAAVILLRFQVLSRFGPEIWTTPYRDTSLLERIPVALSITAESLRLMVFPTGMRIFYHASEMTDVTFVRSIFLFAYAVLVVLLLATRSPTLFWVLFVPVSLATVMNIVPIGAAFAERFLYLPSAGACAAAGLGLAALASWEQRSRMTQHFLWIPLVAVIALGSMTWVRNPVFHDSVALWEDAVRKAPEYPYPHYNLGKSYYDRPEYRDYQSPDRPGALEELRRSLELNPHHSKALLAHYYLGKYYYEHRRDGRLAADHFRSAVRGVDPELLSLEPVLLKALHALVRIAIDMNGLIVPLEEAEKYLDDAEKGGYESKTVIPLRRELEQALEKIRNHEGG